jgi:Tol biopolymer transport system component/DNA-binding winged helix-turn-helix (wHTH) protein
MPDAYCLEKSLKKLLILRIIALLSHLIEPRTIPARADLRRRMICYFGGRFRYNFNSEPIMSSIPNSNNKIYEFGQFQLNKRQRLLLLAGNPVKMPAKSFEVLLYLIENRDEVVGREELIRSVWQESFVEDSNVTVHISNLRRILSDGVSKAKIETFPKIGYRFVGEVVEHDTELKNEFTKAESSPISNDEQSREPSSEPEKRKQAEVKKTRPAYRPLVTFSLCLLLIAIAAISWSRLSADNRNLPFRNIAITKLTNLGNSNYAVVSPDGQYVLYNRVGKNEKTFNLWLRVVGTMSETEILPMTDGSLTVLAFLPDGKHIAYGYRENQERQTIYITPLFGGPRQKLPIEALTDISFSPDGSSLAYIIRESNGKSIVFVSNADGSNPRQVAARQMPDLYNFSYHPAWSPDGKKLACLGQNGGDNGPRLFEIDLSTGAESVITKETWTWITEFSWLPDSTGLLMVAASQTSSLMQIWRISYPGGEAVQVTNDTANYFSLSSSKDGNSLVTSQRRIPNVIWTVPARGAQPGAPDASAVSVETDHALQVSQGNADGVSYTNAHAALDWTPDGRLIFTSEDAGNIDVWSMDSNGGRRRQLTADLFADTGPAVSPDGRQIVFMSRRTGKESLWIMNSDGTDQREFFNMSIERQPEFSADGQWIYFSSLHNGASSIWRRRVDGGEATEVVPGPAVAPEISPDGRLLLYRTPKAFVVMEIESGQIAFTFPGPGRRAKWLPSGRGFTFLDNSDDVDNVWLQALDQTKRRQLTDFRSDGVMLHGWSPDGKTLALARGTQVSDIVLINNIK